MSLRKTTSLLIKNYLTKIMFHVCVKYKCKKKNSLIFVDVFKIANFLLSFFSKKVNKIFRIEKKVSPHLYVIMQSISIGESKLIQKSSFFFN